MGCFFCFMLGIYVGQFSPFYFTEKKNQMILIEIETVFLDYDLTTNSHQLIDVSKGKQIFEEMVSNFDLIESGWKIQSGYKIYETNRKKWCDFRFVTKFSVSREKSNDVRLSSSGELF